MFGPNNNPSIHHREPAFEKLYFDLEDTFKKAFTISDEYNILAITGSGTVALETVLNSIKPNIKHEFVDAEFGKRMKLVNHSEEGNEGIAYPLYETSISRYQDIKKQGKLKIVDAVSAFPYYDIPDDADIWVTVNSKQIGCNPGLSFIGIKKSAMEFVKEEEFSYLSLKRYLNYKDQLQTPNTPAIALMQETLEHLKDFDLPAFRRMIDSRRERLEKLFGKYSIGDGPVMTIESNPTVNKIKKIYNLYGKHNTQIFLWSGSEMQYEKFIFEVEQKFKGLLK